MVKRLKAIMQAAGFALVLAPSISAGQDLGAGWDAYEMGDFAAALREWQPLAEQENALAQYSLGFMYREGEGVPQDYAEAVRWYRMAAEQGYAPAQFNLGFMYDEGMGVPQDYTEAMQWYRMAAE